ncbi:MAG: hypothetical protein OHK0052_00150 [Anaerolineales bacterium]
MTRNLTPLPLMLQRLAYILRRLMSFTSLLFLLSAIAYIWTYFQAGNWQILADAGVSLLCSTLAVTAYFLVQRGQVQSALRLAYTILLVAPFAYWFAGYNPVVVVAMVAGAFMIFLSVDPRRWQRWLAQTILYALYEIALIVLNPFENVVLEPNSVTFWTNNLLVVVVLFFIGREFFQTYPTLSIRNRLLISSLILALLPPVIVATVFGLIFINNGRNQTLEQMQGVVQLKRAQLDLWVDSLQTSLTTLREETGAVERFEAILTLSESNPRRIVALQALEQRFARMVEDNGDFDEVLLITADGDVILSTDAAQIGKRFAQRKFFIFGKSGPYINAPFYDAALDRTVIWLSLPVYNRADVLIGVLAARPNALVFNKIISQQIGLGQTGESYLVGINNTLLSRLRNADFAVGQAFIRSQPVQQALTTQRDVSGLFSNYNNQPVVGAYAWLPSYQMVLVAEQAQSEAFRFINQTLLFGIVTLGLALLMALIVGLNTTRAIANPLGEVARVAEDIASGNFNVQITERGEDEIGQVMIAFNRMIQRLRESFLNLENRIQERTAALENRSRQIETIAQLGNAITNLRNFEDLLAQATVLMSDRLDFYHVGIFLLDDSNAYAILRAANSDGGQKMLAQGYRIPVQDGNIIGNALLQSQPRIALDVGEDAIAFAYPDLPETRSEMALPLRVGQQQLGVLDVHSRYANAFSMEDIAILQILADQIAVAINNARLFEETQQALESARRAYRESSEQEWQKILLENADLGYVATPKGIFPSESDWQPTMQTAARENRLTIDAENLLALPIQLRGQTLGVLRLRKKNPKHAWSEREIGFLNNLAEQLAVALESARLYSDAQRRAARERLLSEAATRMRETLDVDSVLQTAILEIRRALQLSEVEVRMKGAEIARFDTEPEQ